MAVTIAATQLTAGVPPFAQVVVNGLTNGDQFVVEGTAGIHSWLVQGGMGISDGLQLILADTRVPWGGAVTYRVTVASVITEAAPLTVAYEGAATVVFQSLDGSSIVPVEVATYTDPKTSRTRRAFFVVSGRRSMVLRHDVTGLPERPLVLETEGATSADLEALLASGKPIVRRQLVGLRDIAPVQIISVGDFTSELVGAVGDLRVWSMPTQEIAVPEPGTVLFVFDWDDFDAVYAALTWNQFDTEWSTRTWDQFDTENWGARL